MRVDLPSGGWVEYRDNLLAQDRFDVQEAATVNIADGTRQVISPLGMLNAQRNALLAKVITNWSLAEEKGIPIPANNPGGAEILGTALDLDDYNALEAAIEPLFDRVRGQGGGTPN
jgi:hypothetical protein